MRLVRSAAVVALTVLAGCAATSQADLRMPPPATAASHRSMTAGVSSLPQLGASQRRVPAAMRHCFPRYGHRVRTVGDRRGEMHGDLDGMGRSDAVWATARLRQGRCRYYLVASLGSAVSRIRVRGDRNYLGLVFQPLALANIDTHKGLEIVALVGRGAADAFVQVFTIRHHRLVWMRVHGPAAPAGSTFDAGGSVMDLAGVDCAPHRPRGFILVSGASSNNTGTRYQITRDYFVVAGTRFGRVGRTRHYTVPPRGLRRFPELGSQPFASCTIVHASP